MATQQVNSNLSNWFLPLFKVNNPLRLNTKIREEEGYLIEVRPFCCLCPRLQTVIDRHLTQLRAEYAANLAAAAVARREIGTGIIPPLQTCIMNEQEGHFLALLRAGEDVNFADRCGRTPLHKAAEQGNKRFVEILLMHPDISIHLQTRKGKTAEELTHNPEIQALLRV